jgi:hypothetical protein
MYHVELRQFPHNFCHFNLTEQELHETILDAWAQGEWIEVGERKWNPHQATLTVLEGPQLPVEQLSMGRGWRNAVRQGRNVTEQLVAAARVAPGGLDRSTGDTPSGGVEPAGQLATGAESGRAAAPLAGLVPDARLIADSLGLEALAKLGSEPVPLAEVWRLARVRFPEHPASDCLKLAEHAIRSLADAGLVVVLVAGETGEPDPCSSAQQIEQTLRAIDSWAISGDSARALIRRA